MQIGIIKWKCGITVQYDVVINNKTLKICNTLQQAQKFIKKYRKGVVL